MKKSERLIYLLELLNEGGRFSLEEISHRCKISDRTVYRDLRSLSELGFPVLFNEGYRLGQIATHSIFNRFTDTELRLIRFALNTHPLGKLFPFAKLSERLTEDTIPLTENELRTMQGTVFSFENGDNSPGETSTDNLLFRFIRAVEIRRQVRLSTTKQGAMTTYIPVAIKIHRSQVVLIVASHELTGTLEIPLDEVTGFELATDSFSHRPVELLHSEPMKIG